MYFKIKIHWGKHLFGCFLFLGFVGFCHAQERILFGQVRDGATNKPIPFVHVIHENSGRECLSDMEGKYSFAIKPGTGKMIFKAYQYLDAEVEIGQEDSLDAHLFYAHPFSFQTITAPATRKLINDLRKVRSRIDPRKEVGFQYQSYNKVLITTSYISSLKMHMDHLLGLFGRNRLATYGSDHHILLMESATERDVKERFAQRETMTHSKISGINRPPALSLISGFEPLSIYEPYLRIGTKKYVSPLAGRPHKRYIFFVLDTIKLADGQRVKVVKFNPRSTRNKDLLQGIFYVAEKPLGVMAFQAWPAYDRESTFSLMQEAALVPSGRWFPHQIKTTYQRERLGGLKIPIEASSKTYIFNMEPRHEKPGERFSEIIFDFQKDSLKSGSQFPAPLRQERLTEKDQNTYRYFDQIGSLEGLDRYLNFGQKLMAGRIPFGRVDLVFRKAFTVNDFEGLRLGLGLQSTEKWSTRHQGGGYFAYGTKDEKEKFGVNYQYRISEAHAWGISYQNDLAEPGMQALFFPKPQYGTEQLRNVRIPRFDEIRHLELAYLGHWRPNLESKITLDLGRRNYLYSYRFLPDADQSGIGISELKWGLRWSPGEQFARYVYESISLGSPYPTSWIQISQGLKGLQPEAYNFTRLEFRSQWTRKILGLGEMGIQIQAGRVWGQIPYSLLFTARGSFKDVSFLSYNSFETMRYNEFINDRFFVVHFSHRFSRMQISTLPFRPYFTLIHNMGWGKLDNKENHQLISFSDMPKGYVESGLFLNDIFVIPLAGVHLGIGTGAFIRYGDYSLPGALNNLAIKFSTNLSL